MMDERKRRLFDVDSDPDIDSYDDSMNHFVSKRFCKEINDSKNEKLLIYTDI